MARTDDLTLNFLFALFVSTLGPLLFGYHLAELNAPQQVITCAKTTASGGALARIYSTFTTSTTTAGSTGLPRCIPMTPAQFGLVSSFFTLGGLIGALAAGPITGRYGRLKSMIYASGFAALGPVFEALAPDIGIMTLGRFVAGLGAGAATVTVPIYISEIAPPNQKGFFGSFTQVMINSGIFITQLLGFFLSHGQFWRIVLAVGGVIALAQTIGLLLGGQESPKWLADNGKSARARRILRKLRGHEVDIEAEVSGWGMDSAQDADDEEDELLREDHEHASSSSDRNNNTATQQVTSDAKKLGKFVKQSTIGPFAVLRHPDYYPAVFAVMMIMVAQQLCGINSIVMYGVGLLSDLLAANSALLNVGVSALNIIITVSAAPLVDRLGRKTCLLVSITGMGISDAMLAVGIMKHIPILAAVSVILFITSFGLGLGPIPFILSSELVGAEAVGATQSWALAANWIATFLVAQFFPIVNEKLGKGQVYFIFAGFAVLFGAFTAYWVPETKGKKDANEVWGRKKADHRED